MTLRQLLNRYPFIVASVAIVLLGLVAFRWFQNANAQPTQSTFYTTDDGATLFTDDLAKVPPFDHDGKPAVKAFVFTCDGGQHQFVQYLFKYGDQVKQQIEALHMRNPMNPGLIKRPGDARWLDETDPNASKIMAPKCPDGSGPGPMRQVWP